MARRTSVKLLVEVEDENSSGLKLEYRQFKRIFRRMKKGSENINESIRTCFIDDKKYPKGNFCLMPTAPSLKVKKNAPIIVLVMI